MADSDRAKVGDWGEAVDLAPARVRAVDPAQVGVRAGVVVAVSAQVGVRAGVVVAVSAAVALQPERRRP